MRGVWSRWYSHMTRRCSTSRQPCRYCCLWRCACCGCGAGRGLTWPHTVGSACGKWSQGVGSSTCNACCSPCGPARAARECSGPTPRPGVRVRPPLTKYDETPGSHLNWAAERDTVPWLPRLGKWEEDPSQGWRWTGALANPSARPRTGGRIQGWLVDGRSIPVPGAGVTPGASRLALGKTVTGRQRSCQHMACKGLDQIPPIVGKIG